MGFDGSGIWSMRRVDELILPLLFGVSQKYEGSMKKVKKLRNAGQPEKKQLQRSATTTRK